MNKYFIKAFDAVINIAQTPSRLESIALRKKYFDLIKQGPIVKIAFDTRRVNTETDFIPRRNLQNYHRSEAFIDKESSEKLKNLFKVKTAVDSIKYDFEGDPDWHDSYCRILSAALDRTLRVEQKDMDFFKPQLEYLEELMYLRYRLRPEDIQANGEKELRQIVLDKDEKLLHKMIYSNYNDSGLHKNNMAYQQLASQSSVQFVNSQESFVEKLLGQVKANKDNKEVERSVTITIKDKIVDDKVENKQAESKPESKLTDGDHQ